MWISMYSAVNLTLLQNRTLLKKNIITTTASFSQFKNLCLVQLESLSTPCPRHGLTRHGIDVKLDDETKLPANRK